MQDFLNTLQPYYLWIFSTLGTLVMMAGVASKWIPKDSTLGLWVAWFATMPLGHAPTKLSGQLARVEAAIEDSKAQPTKLVNGLLFVGLLLAVSGCAGSFEEAKLAGTQSRKATPPVALSTPERCQSLSERQYWFTGAGIASGAIGAAAAGMTLPIESKTVDTVLIVTTVAGGVGAAGFGWFGTAAGADYVRECQ